MDTYILSAVRTPVGKFLGGLSELPATRLAAAIIPEALQRAGVETSQVDEAIFGQVLQAGCGQNPARQACLFAGLPVTLPALTVNKVCGSGLKAVILAAQAIRAGDAQIILAGGMESMSRAPHLVEGLRGGLKYGDSPLVDELIRDGLWCPFENWPMGKAAEHTAVTHGITREAQDRFAAESHQKAAAAWKSGAFTNEVVPLTIGAGPKSKTISRDEGIRPDSSVEGLARLKPAFDPAGTVTPGNASQLSDGAAALIIASGTAIRTSGAKPLARIVASATSGVEPRDIFTAPVLAIQFALARASLKLDDIDLFEINEAFAAQMLACVNELRLDPAKVNIHGGGIALGHPIGASGARVLVSLVHALHARQLRRGIASLCLGGGNAVAMIIERM